MVLAGSAEGRRAWQERLRTGLLWGFWLLTGFLALIALLRAAGVSPPGPLATAVRYTFWIFLPCYVVVIGAAARRRWRLCLLNVGLAVGHLAWVLPTVPAAQGMPFDIANAERVRVLTANVSHDNPTPGKLLAEIESEDPDVVVLVEYTTRWQEVVGRRRSFGERYPERYEVVRDDASGIAVFAKIPLTDTKSVNVGGWPIVRTTVTLNGQPVRIYGIHAVGPDRDGARHRRQHDRITELVAAEPDGRALVVAGHFNATPYEPAYGAYADLGLDNAHEQRGRGFAWTYPNGAGWPRSWLKVRIDHVFVSEELVAVRIWEGQGAGSDHRPVVADVAFRPRFLIDRSR